MSELTNQEIREHDIDWYCLVNQKPVHIASMGGMIPRSFRDRAKLRKLQRKVAEMKPFTEAILNYDTVNRLITTGYEYLENGDIRQNIVRRNENDPGCMYLRDEELAIRLFASSFVERARRGFYSFVRDENSVKEEYLLIASPREPINYIERELPLVSYVHDRRQRELEFKF